MTASVQTQAAGGLTVPPRDHVERMARSGGLSVLGAGISAVAGVALTALITNGLDQNEAGTVFATTAVALIATSFVQLGTEVGIVRQLPGVIVRGQGRHLRAVLRHALGPVVAVSVLVAVAGYVFAPALAGRVAHGGSPGSVAGQLRVLSVLLPVMAVYNVLQAATRGLRSMGATVVVESLGRSVGQLVAVGLVQLLGLGAVAVVAAYSAPYVAALLATVVWLLVLVRRQERAARDRPRAADPAGHPRSADVAGPAGPVGAVDAADGGPAAATRGFWHFTAPRALGTTSQMLLKRSDIVLVAALRSPREAALYAAASRFVVVGQLGVQALQQALSPQLAALFAREDQAAAREVYRATTAWSMLVSWPVYLTCAVLAPELLRAFGRGYDGVAPVAVMLSLAMLASTACGAVDTVLLMSGHPWLSLGNNVGTLVLNVGLNLVLIPHFGALGAGISWTLAILVRNLLPLGQIAYKHRISPVSGVTGFVGLSAGVCFGLVPLAARLVVGGTLPVLVALLAGAAAYVGLVWRRRGALQIGAFRGVLRRRVRGGGSERRSQQAVELF